jgi:hypothetical protein
MTGQVDILSPDRGRRLVGHACADWVGRGRLVLALLLVAATLSACGRSGSIRPPGPPDQVTFPRAYPSR